MDTIPDKDPMDKPSPLSGLDPADLLRQGAADDTLADEAAPSFHPPSLEEMAGWFPRFEILGLIGQGGMGAVYKVRQKDLDRVVALKILPPAIGATPGFSERFTREAKALAKLNHPAIVTLHEFGQTPSEPPLPFILMEFVDGVNLAQLMKSGRIAPREALAIVPQICDALQYAHDHSIVHRDIKPENILLDRLGRVKVADFGIAKVVESVTDDPLRSGDIPVSTDATIAGKVLGTPQYMAPEQIERPSEVDHRADIYALGVVFYQMLTGELPSQEFQAPSRKISIDVRLDEMVLRAMEKEPERRYQTALEFRTAIDGLPPVTPLPVPERGMMRRWWWVFLVMIPLGMMLGLLAAGVVAYVMPKKYEVEAVVEVKPPAGSMVTPKFIGNQFAAMKSPALLGNVSQELELPEKWYTDEEGATRILKAIVNTQRIRGTDLITLKVRHTNREDAVRITKAVIRNYQRIFGGEVIVHEAPNQPKVLVSPNVKLLPLLGGLGGLVLSPLLALLLIPLLHRLVPRKDRNGTTARDGQGSNLALWSIVVFLTISVAGGAFLIAGLWMDKPASRPEKPAPSLASASKERDLYPIQGIMLERGRSPGGLDLDTEIFKVYRPTGGMTDAAMAIRWRVDNGIDLLLDQDSAVPGVLLAGIDVMEVATVWWTEPPEARVVEASLPPREDADHQNEDMTFLAANGPASGSGTHAFRTAEGSVGILHLEPATSATGVHVEWRLIGNRGVKGKAAAAASEARVEAPPAEENRLEVRVEVSREGPDKTLRIDSMPTGELVKVGKEIVVSDKHVKSAFLGAEGNRYWLDITLNKEGGQRLAGATHGEPGQVRLVILVDGKVKSAPVVQAGVSDHFQISGLKTAEEALELLRGFPAGSPRKESGERVVDVISDGVVKLDGSPVSLPDLADEFGKSLLGRGIKVRMQVRPEVSDHRIGEIMGMLHGVLKLSFSSIEEEERSRVDQTDQEGHGKETSNDTRSAVEQEIALDLAKRYLTLVSEVARLQASGVGRNHPSYLVAYKALVRFEKAHPSLPDADCLKLAEARLAEMEDELASLKDGGIGERHPSMTSKREEMEVIEEMIRSKARPILDEAEAGEGNPAETGDRRSEGVSRWLAVLDAGNYPDSYTALAQAASSQLTLKQWETLVGAARKPLGALVSRKLLASEPLKEIPGMPAAEGMAYQFSSEFAEKEAAVETVILVKEGEVWKPAGYFVK